MRINRFVATATGLSRRAADTAIAEGRVNLNGRAALIGDQVSANDQITLDGRPVAIPATQTIMLHKPVGYITSRRQQGATPTIYALLPEELQRLKPVGRLDRDSSGLLLLTDDGLLAQRLQHPSTGKWKRYQVRLNRPLKPNDEAQISKGVELEDGLSHMRLDRRGQDIVVELQEGRNRQIRRSFAALGYKVTALHRTDFGEFALGELASGSWQHASGKDSHGSAR